MIKRLRDIKHTLLVAAEEQMENLDCVDAKELGEVIDMIKDIEEAIYYCTVTDAMVEKGYSTTDWNGGWGYVGNDGGSTVSDMHAHGRHDLQSTGDPREGTSHAQRRMYIESKEMHHGKAKQLQELEKYMKDLSNDLVEMIDDASPEEKQYAKN